MKAQFIQDGFNYSFNFTGVKSTELSKLIGTACNRFFNFAMVCKKTGVKSCKFNQPIQLVITNDKDVPLLDSFDLEQFATSLKLVRTKEGLNRFASRTLEIVQFAMSDIDIITVEDIQTEVAASLN